MQIGSCEERKRGGKRERDHPIASGEAFVAEKYHVFSVKKNALRIQWFVSRSADTSSEK